MARQGVTGPKPRPLSGNILEISAMVSQSVSKDCDSIHHDIVGRLLPHYGYARHMVECTSRLVERLRKEVGEEGEVEIGVEMHQLTADIISRTEFGSSFEKGKELYNHLTVLQRLCAQATRHLYLPGSRFLPSKYNREIKSLKKEVERLLIEVIQSRRDCAEMGRSSTHGNDLLGLLLDEMDSDMNNINDNNNNLHLIMDECKTFFFAGHETIALLLTWTMMLLADNSAWQENVRDEIRDVCGCKGLPSVDQLSKLTSLNKVINESLRLYPPATLLPRMAFKDIKLGDITIPKGLSIWIPVLAIHHSEELWGKDANEFNPERFGGKPFAPGRHFIPFATGPRNCIGQSFAMMEAKMILATLILKFSFTMSKNYRHAPIVVLTIKPKYGVQKKKSLKSPSFMKSKDYPLFRREKLVHKNHGGGLMAEVVMVGVTFSSVLTMDRSDSRDLYYNLAQVSSRYEDEGRGGGVVEVVVDTTMEVMVVMEKKVVDT
ncbi:hypothetical protein Bca4012_083080 [Brassica carinata]